MAIEKAKVFAALQLKFKGKSLTKTFLDKTATRYALKIENDADLDDYINEREEDILAAGEEADRRVTAATKKPKEGEGTKPEAKTEPEIDEDELKDAPPYVKAMMKKMQGMADEIKGFKSEKTVESLQSRFLKDDRLKGINPVLLKGRYPKTEEEFEAAVTETAEELKDFIKEDDGQQQQQQSAQQTKLGGGKAVGDRPVHTNINIKPADKSKDVPAEITQFTDNLNKSQAKNTVKT